jgi:hypothetical protein
MLMRPMVAIAFLFLTYPSIAQDAKPLDQLRKQEQKEHLLNKLDDLDAVLERLSRKRETDCAKAIGYKPFCECVLRDLPVAWTFLDYVAITTGTKEENGYVKMDKEYQSAYEKGAPIRDKCVRAINAKR